MESYSSSRHWLLLLFAVATFSNAFLRISFSPVNAVVEKHFGVALDDVNWLSTVSSFVYVLVFLPAAWLFETTGDLRTGIVVGCWLDLAGGWIRYLGAGIDGFFLLLAGQMLSEIGQVFLVIIPSRLAAVWYPFESRALACACGIAANQMGVAAGFFIAPLVVHRGVDLRLYLLIQAIVCSAVLLLILLSFRSDPPQRALMSGSLKPPRQQFQTQFATQPKFVSSPLNRTLNYGDDVSSITTIDKITVTSTSTKAVQNSSDLYHSLPDYSESTIDTLSGTGVEYGSVTGDVIGDVGGSKTGYQRESVLASIWRILVASDSSAFAWMTFAFGLVLGASFAFQSLLPRLLPPLLSDAATPPASSDSLAGGLHDVYNAFQQTRALCSVGFLIFVAKLIDIFPRHHKHIGLVLAILSAVLSLTFSALVMYFSSSLTDAEDSGVTTIFWLRVTGLSYGLMSGSSYGLLLAVFEWAPSDKKRNPLLVFSNWVTGVMFGASQFLPVLIISWVYLWSINDSNLMCVVITACAIAGALATMAIRDHDDDFDRCRQKDRLRFGYANLYIRRAASIVVQPRGLFDSQPRFLTDSTRWQAEIGEGNESGQSYPDDERTRSISRLTVPLPEEYYASKTTASDIRKTHKSSRTTNTGDAPSASSPNFAIGSSGGQRPTRSGGRNAFDFGRIHSETARVIAGSPSSTVGLRNSLNSGVPINIVPTISTFKIGDARSSSMGNVILEPLAHSLPSVYDEDVDRTHFHP